MDLLDELDSSEKIYIIENLCSRLGYKKDFKKLTKIAKL